MALLKNEPLTIEIGKVRPFGPFDIPDEFHRVFVSIARWTDPATVVSWTRELSLDGTTWASPDVAILEGGPIEPDRLGRDVSRFWTLWPTIPMRCAICGNEYVPNHPLNEAKNDPGLPLAERGWLAHSTRSLKAGKSLGDLRSAAKGYGDVRNADIAYFAKRAVENDEQVIDTVFHTPVPSLPAGRLFRMSFELVSGSALDTDVSLEIGQ